MEEWRPVVGWEGAYEVSSDGRVRSVVRIVKMGNGAGSMRTIGGDIMSSCIANNGYTKISLKFGSKSKTTSIHRLVAEAFIACEKTGMQVNHIDGNKLNNHVANLEWVTPGENTRHSISILGNSVTGGDNANAKLTSSQVVEIVKRHRSGESPKSLACEFGVSQTHISRIMAGCSWRSATDGIVEGYVFNEDRANLRGEFNGRAKLTAETVAEARKLHASGISSNDIARRFGVSFSTMHSAIKGHSWKSVK